MPKRAKKKASLDPDIVVTRILTDETTRRRIVVTLWKPREVRPDEWSCAFQITGMGKKKAFGLDAIQSLYMALEAIRVHLKEAKRRYTWEGGEPGDAGFLQTIPAYFGMKFVERASALVEREARTFSRHPKRRRNG